MRYKLKFHKLALKEFENLPSDIKKLAKKQLRKILNFPQLGKNLTGNLKSLKKIYFNKKRIELFIISLITN